jgi:acyl-coenzyme A synthetase/AMP-(fatty) acid ligase
VKLRGFRIELEEVQVALDAHPGVRESVVLLAQGPGGDARLVAHLVPGVSPGPGAGELRAFLRERLPEHMVPAAFVTLDAMPLTASGKIDRRALQAAQPPGAPDVLAHRRQSEAMRRLMRARGHRGD